LALRLIKELCGGEASELTLSGATPGWQKTIALRAERIKALGGVEIAPDKAQAILQTLGFSCAATNDGWEVSPPSWRADIESDADLIEELLRINGYGQIP